MGIGDRQFFGSNPLLSMPHLNGIQEGRFNNNAFAVRGSQLEDFAALHERQRDSDSQS